MHTSEALTDQFFAQLMHNKIKVQACCKYLQGASFEKYCNCTPTGQQYFVSTTPSTPVEDLTKQQKLYVKYEIRSSLHKIYKKHRSMQNTFQC